jgi:hypothetical protein
LYVINVQSVCCSLFLYSSAWFACVSRCVCALSTSQRMHTRTESDASVQALRDASAKGGPNTVKALLTQGVNVHSKDEYGYGREGMFYTILFPTQSKKNKRKSSTLCTVSHSGSSGFQCCNSFS